MRALVAVLGVLIVGSACSATLSPAAQRVKITTKAETERCLLLRVVYGHREQNMLLTEKQRALEAAAQVGATHIVPLIQSKGYTADAFDCSKQSPAVVRAKKESAKRKAAVAAVAAHRARAKQAVVPAPRVDKPDWVIAVMNVEDRANVEEGVESGLTSSLGEQLRVFIAERGIRTIDRGLQDRALKEQVASMKAESYQACYDNSCQIELGKALAATHIMRAQISKFGRSCVLNAELVDLRTEVNVAAASSRGPCEAEGFLTMSDEVTRNLVNSAIRAAR